MKGNLFLGTASGKLGDFVGKVVHGQQIYAKYQPIVFNPKSSSQVTNRVRFSISNSALKEFRSLLLQNDLNILYQVYSGASKNIRNIYVPYVMELLKIESIGAYSMFPKMQNPLTVESVTGNVIQSYVDVTAGYAGFGSANDPGMGYFGSNVELNINSSLCGFASIVGEDYPHRVLNQVRPMTLTLVPHTNVGPKGYGIKTSIADCGNWPFIYSVANLVSEDTSIGFGIGTAALPYDATNNQYSGYMFWVDGNSRPIASVSFFGLQTKPVTP